MLINIFIYLFMCLSINLSFYLFISIFLASYLSFIYWFSYLSIYNMMYRIISLCFYPSKTSKLFSGNIPLENFWCKFFFMVAGDKIFLKLDVPTSIYLSAYTWWPWQACFPSSQPRPPSEGSHGTKSSRPVQHCWLPGYIDR